MSSLCTRFGLRTVIGIIASSPTTSCWHQVLQLSVVELQLELTTFVLFRLSDMGFARLQAARKQAPMASYGAYYSNNSNKVSRDASSPTTSAGAKPSRRRLPAVGILFEPGSLGLRLRESKSCGGATIVSGYARGTNNELLQAEVKVYY